MYIDTYCETLLLFRKYTFFKIQLSYTSVWLTGILLTIGNILIKNLNVHFHFGLDWTNPNAA